jgi:hypothetical protein
MLLPAAVHASSIKQVHQKQAEQRCQQPLRVKTAAAAAAAAAAAPVNPTAER